MFKKLQPAVKKETLNVTLYVVVGVILMDIVLFVLNRFIPDTVPFDWKVIISSIGGGVVAVANFFFMAVTVQIVAGTEDEKKAQTIMKTSFARRMLMQVLWIIASILAPCFWFVSGIVPLLVPSAGIKLKGIFSSKEVELKEDGH